MNPAILKATVRYQVRIDFGEQSDDHIGLIEEWFETKGDAKEFLYLELQDKFEDLLECSQWAHEYDEQARDEIRSVNGYSEVLNKHVEGFVVTLSKHTGCWKYDAPTHRYRFQSSIV